MKKLCVFFCVATAFLMVATDAMARPVFNRQEYKEKQTFEADAVVKDDAIFGEDASIKSDRRRFIPNNMIQNSLLGVWSGGTRYGSGALASVPDGWNIQGATTGVTRVDLSDVDPLASASGSTIYQGFPHSMYVQTWGGSTGAGTTRYITYPAEIGVSTAATWYRQFIGKRLVFGAWVWKDQNQAAASGVTTAWIRPFINTYGSAGYLAGETSFAFGSYHGTDGWECQTAVTTVPNGATALEVGFAMNPTVLAPITGDSAYVCAPFLLIDPLNSDYVPTPQETIYFINAVDFQQNGTGFDLAAGTSSFDVATDTAGRLPSPGLSDAYLISIQGQYDGELHLQFRTDTNQTTGTTYYIPSSGNTGTSKFTVNDWVKPDYNGDFDLYTNDNVNGVSMFVKAVKLKR